MRVGVCVEHLDETVGGGHTFQGAVLESIARAGGDESAVQYVIVTRDRGAGRSHHGVSTVAAGAGAVGSFFEANAVTMRALLARVAPRQAQGMPLPFDERLRRARIDALWYMTPAWRPTDLPFVYTHWDLQHIVQPHFPEVRRGAEWERREQHQARAFARATRIIVANDRARDEVAARYGLLPEQFLVIPHPALPLPEVDDATASAKLERWGLSDARYLFFPAQAWPHKNHVQLVRVLARLGDGGDEWTLVLTGSDKGNLAHVYEVAERLGVRGRIRHLGFVEREELGALYRRAHALVFPSFFGPENLPPLEAMSVGCPVVAADVPGMREQLGDAALWADPIDVTMWVERIRALGDPTTRRKIAARGVERVAGRSADDYVRKVHAFWERFRYVRESWPAGV